MDEWFSSWTYFVRSENKATWARFNVSKMINYGFSVVAFVIVITVLNFQRGMSNCEIDFFIYLFSVTFSLNFLINLVSAIKCWRCSSDAANAGFCDDPFDEVNDFQTQQSYVECDDSIPKDNSVRRAVCKKVKRLSTSAIDCICECFMCDE